VTLNPKKSPVVYSLLWACGFVFMATGVPIWIKDSTPATAPATGWVYFHDNLWGVLALYWDDIRKVGPGFLIRLFPQNILPVLTAAILGAVLGRINYWLRWGRAHNFELPSPVIKVRPRKSGGWSSQETRGQGKS
jgi:hypothetical protein